MPKKIVRKKPVKGPDEFISFTAKAMDFITVNYRAVGAALVVVALLGVTYAGWNKYSGSKENEASDAFYEAMKLTQKKVQPFGNSTGAYKSEGEKHTELASRFSEISGKYKGSRIEPVSLVYAANSNFKMGKFDAAIELYNKFLFKIERDDPNLHGNLKEIAVPAGTLRDSALEGLAYAYEYKGNTAKAIEAISTIASSPDSYLRESALYDLGRLYEKTNDRAKAVEHYQKLISDYPESPEVIDVKKRIDRLKT